MHEVLQPQLALAALATVLAGIVRGFTGFGAAMMQMPIFALLYSPPQAVATMAGLGTLASLQLLPGALRHCQWREVLPLTLAAWLTIPLGSLVLLSLEPEVMRRGIAGIVLVLVVLLMAGVRFPGGSGPWGAAGAGAASGLINGATGVGGPPVILYMLARRQQAAASRANLIVYYTFLGAGTSASLAWHGVFTAQILWRVAALWPVQFVTVWVGVRLFRRASDAIYRRIALALLLAVGVFGLLYRP